MMTIDEGKKAIEELKAQGNSEEEIAGSMYLMFKNGEITVEELEAFIGLMGFELTEEFKNMDPESQKEKGYELTNEDAEPEGEAKPQEEQKEQKNPKDDGDNDEEKEEKQAMGLFNKKDAPKEEESDEEKEAMKMMNL